jgi:hypothetical protein
MTRILSYLFLSIIVLDGARAIAAPGPDMSKFSWRAVEIYGNRAIEDKVVMADLPVKLGASIVEGKKELDTWCSALAGRITVTSAQCNTVFLRGDRAYLVIDIVERGDNRSEKIEATKGKTDLKLDAALSALSEEIRKQEEESFFARKDTSPDLTNSNFLDYKDKTLHDLAQKLHAQVSPRAEEVIKVATESSSDEQRRAATFLLNWAGDPVKTIRAARRLVLDNDQGVRNSATNFVLAFVRLVRDKELLDQIAEDLFSQVQLPAHTDRNKALYAILQLQKVVDQPGTIMTPSRIKILEDIVARSHLPNISVPARRILQVAQEQAAVIKAAR